MDGHGWRWSKANITTQNQWKKKLGDQNQTFFLAPEDKKEGNHSNGIPLQIHGNNVYSCDYNQRVQGNWSQAALWNLSAMGDQH
jgi:hypothetical protein